MRKLWFRYLFREAFKVLLLFLVCFYFLYVLIDYASHPGRFSQGDASIDRPLFFRYYLSLMMIHIDILLPIGILLSAIKTLCQFNLHCELLALQVGNLSKKRLLSPLLVIGLTGTALLYLNEEYTLPLASKTLQQLDHDFRLERNKKNPFPMVHVHQLNDHSLLLYHSYHPEKHLFHDAYWVLSPNEIYHMHTLYPYSDLAVGEDVVHLLRNESGHLTVDRHFATKTLPSLRFNPESLRDVTVPIQERAISELWMKRPFLSSPLDELGSQWYAALYKKMAFPWLCLFAILGPAPACTRFRRDLPVTLLYLFGLFSFIAFYMFLDALTVIAARQVLSPFWAIWPFFAGVSILSLYRFATLDQQRLPRWNPSR